jgi:hypothetical protein
MRAGQLLPVNAYRRSGIQRKSRPGGLVRFCDKSGVGLPVCELGHWFPIVGQWLFLSWLRPALRSPGSDELAAYGRAADLLNFMDYPRQNVALRSLKHRA